jgi:hypothetical protein
MSRHEPVLNPVKIADLRPTQITVGYREVEEKRRAWRERSEREGGKFLGRHMIPVVRGPKDRRYVLDHHHLCRALLDEGEDEVLADVLADLRTLKPPEFWAYLDHRAWCHPYDRDGQRVGYDEIPESIARLADDPYRSLAGELRRAGGFAKDITPFSEFIWANYLRRRVKRKLVDDDFGAALTKALRLAKSPDAAFMPGWCGPLPEA